MLLQPSPRCNVLDGSPNASLTHLPLMMIGLLWLLVVFEGQDSESVCTLTEIITSLLPHGGFSLDESRSSMGTKHNFGLCSKGDAWQSVDGVGGIYTLSLYVWDIQSILQPEDHHSKQKVKSVTETLCKPFSERDHKELVMIKPSRPQFDSRLIAT